MSDKALNFTKAKLDALPLPEPGKRSAYHDTKVPGLIVRVTANGAKTFVVYRRVKGRPCRVTIGPYPTLSIEQARKKAEEINGEIAMGADPTERKRQEAAELTLSEFYARYLEQHSKPHKKSWESDVDHYERFLKRWGHRQLSVIQRIEVRELHSKVGEANGRYTANRLLAMVRGMFNWAIANDLHGGDNPAIGVKPFKEESRDRRLVAHELPNFFKALADEPSQTIRDYILLSLLTGARKSNMLAMRWADIDLAGNTWRIPETKNGTPQTVPLTERAIEILQARQGHDRSPFVFPGSGKSGHLEEPKAGWQRVLERAGLKNLRLHDLRRTLGSWQVDTGATIAIVGKTLNHKSPAATAIYARLDMDPVRQAMEVATEAMYKAAAKGAQ